MPGVDELEAMLPSSGSWELVVASVRGSIRLSAVSASSLRAWAFKSGVEPVFFRCGFVMGDFPTLALARVFAAALFLGFFARSPELEMGAEFGLTSESIPSGELVAVADIPMSNINIESD